MDKIEEIASLIKNSKNIVVLVGAGLSTASNIGDIRSKEAKIRSILLKKKYGYTYEEIVSYSFFIAHPDIFYEYYKNEMVFKDAKPNIAHYFLKQLEKNHHLTLITQNIDGLEKKAGIKCVIDFHGNTQEYYCQNCHKQFDLDYILSFKGIPKCDECNSIIKPNVVLFEEGIDYKKMEQSLKAIKEADLLLVIGSSLNVYPAAGLIYEFKKSNSILINKEITPLDSLFKIVVHDDIIKVVKKLSYGTSI